MTYNPEPLPTDKLVLSIEQKAMLEQIAAHLHDVWATKRVTDGWTYGPKRDDDAKQHPCLVPYEDLPDSEKAYDRAAAEETLKAVIILRG